MIIISYGYFLQNSIFINLKTVKNKKNTYSFNTINSGYLLTDKLLNINKLITSNITRRIVVFVNYVKPMIQ